jgi:hypothetical protein
MLNYLTLSYLESFPYFFLDKKVTKNQDGSKRNFPLIGTFLGRTVPRRSRCCTDLNAVSLIRDTLGITTALIFRSPDFFISETEVRSKNRRLQNFILIGTQRLSLALAFLISLIV